MSSDPYADHTEHVEASERIRTPEEQRAKAALRKLRKQKRNDYRADLEDRVEFLESEVSRLKVKCGETDE